MILKAGGRSSSTSPSDDDRRRRNIGYSPPPVTLEGWMTPPPPPDVVVPPSDDVAAAFDDDICVSDVVMACIPFAVVVKSVKSILRIRNLIYRMIIKECNVKYIIINNNNNNNNRIKIKPWRRFLMVNLPPLVTDLRHF